MLYGRCRKKNDRLLRDRSLSPCPLDVFKIHSVCYSGVGRNLAIPINGSQMLAFVESVLYYFAPCLINMGAESPTQVVRFLLDVCNCVHDVRSRF